MAYYLLGSGGAKFGPADIAMLNAWAQEGRIMPDSWIEDSGGQKIPARAVHGLVLPSGPSTAAPPVGPYDDPVADSLAGGPPIPSHSAQAGPPPSTAGPVSTYSRPGFTQGGSPGNLFLNKVPPTWFGQALACAGGSIVLGIAFYFIGSFFDKPLWFALALPFFGFRLASQGRAVNRNSASLALIFNVLAFLIALGLIAAHYARL